MHPRSAPNLAWWKRIPLEIVLVLGLLAIVFAVSLLSSVGWFVLLRGGLAVSVMSAAVGLPLEIIYFALMITFARRDGDWPRGWIWRSFEHHHRLGAGQRWASLPFFFFGAAAFGVATLATGATVLGLFLGYTSDWKPG